jgi:hypothetical protein
MSSHGKQEPLRLGFLTALALEDGGFVGGLLVTNHFGRPLEFQCTAPVKPNSTQTILYGPTLEPFVLGELIGGTLIEKSGVRPQWIFTDKPQILELRNHIDQPVALVMRPVGDKSKSEHTDSAPAEGAAAKASDHRGMKLGRQTIRFHSAHEEDRELVQREQSRIPVDADLCEPFDRVREALAETLRGSGTRP